MNKTLKRLAEPGSGLYLLVLLGFAVATLFLKMYRLAIAEGAVAVALTVYTAIMRRKREKQLAAYIESVTYDTESAKNNTLMNFPLPIVVFRLDDSKIVWANQAFFEMCGRAEGRLDARVSEMIPGFSGKWLLEGKSSYQDLLAVAGHRYKVHGNIIRSENSSDLAFMGIAYWVDVTDYENIKKKYEDTRPVAGMVVLDNFEELSRNQTNRATNDLRDNIEEILNAWCEENHGIMLKSDKDRYYLMFERQDVEKIKENRFQILEKIHGVTNSNGINATVSLGFGSDAESMRESLSFAQSGTELALSRGGDQAVVKNRLSFEFYGDRGLEPENRSRVKSRVVANTFAELIKDSSSVMVMGHKYADLDSVGSSVAVCCMARKFGVKASIVTDMQTNVSGSLIEALKRTDEYRNVFINPKDAILEANGKTLLVVVDTNRPEQVENQDLLDACNRVAVIDHHRMAATFIPNSALAFIEPYASSVSELMTEILQEVTTPEDILKCEANAMLSGIVLDTKNFTIRTGERTFDAAAYLRRVGADTSEVKKLLQTDMDSTVARYKILQNAGLYRNIAIACPVEEQDRIVAAQAADELLNISGVEASIVVAPDGKGNVFASARSIGDLNVQLIMEKLGGGGNRSAAAAQFMNAEMGDVLKKVQAAIDNYLEGKE